MSSPPSSSSSLLSKRRLRLHYDAVESKRSMSSTSAMRRPAIRPYLHRADDECGEEVANSSQNEDTDDEENNESVDSLSSSSSDEEQPKGHRRVIRRRHEIIDGKRHGDTNNAHEDANKWSISIILLLLTFLLTLMATITFNPTKWDAAAQEGSPPSHVDWRSRKDTLSREMKSLKEEFGSFVSLSSLKTISASLKNVLQERPQQPAVITITTSSKEALRFARGLALKIASLGGKLMDKNNNELVRGSKHHELREASEFTNRSQLFDTLHSQLGERGTFALMNLHQLSGSTAMALHPFCDNINAPFAQAIIVLVALHDDVDNSRNDDELLVLDALATSLASHWRLDLAFDAYSAILSRVLVNVVNVALPKVMVFLQFPSTLTDEEQMLKHKYAQLRRKKKQLALSKAAEKTADKSNTKDGKIVTPLSGAGVKSLPEARDAKEVARKLMRSGAIANIQKSVERVDRSKGFKRSQGLERKLSGMDARAGYQPFSATHGPGGGFDTGGDDVNPDPPEPPPPKRVKDLYESFVSARDREERGLDSEAKERNQRHGHTVYVSGYNITEEVIKGALGQCGKIVNVSMEVEKNCGFVTFDKSESAEKAINEYDKTLVGDVELKVSMARRQPKIDPINDASSSVTWSTIAASHSQKGSHKDKRDLVAYNEEIF